MTRIDPRGPRFGAAITSIVLIAALLLPAPWGITAAVVQWLAFAIGAFLGLQYQPWGVLFRTLVRPRLGPPHELEDPRAPRFSQMVGLLFVTVALLGWAVSLDIVYYVAIGGALAAALLNAIFDLCLGCEMYVRIQRLRHRPMTLREPV